MIFYGQLIVRKMDDEILLFNKRYGRYHLEKLVS